MLTFPFCTRRRCGTAVSSPVNVSRNRTAKMCRNVINLNFSRNVAETWTRDGHSGNTRGEKLPGMSRMLRKYRKC